MSAPPPTWSNPPQNSHINPIVLDDSPPRPLPEPLTIVLDDSPPRPSFDFSVPPALHPPNQSFSAPLFSPSAFAPPSYPPPSYPPPEKNDDIDAQNYFDQQYAAAAFSPNTTRMHPDFEQQSSSVALFDVAPPSYPPPPQQYQPPPFNARIDIDVTATPTKAPTSGAVFVSPGIAGYSPFVHGYSAGTFLFLNETTPGNVTCGAAPNYPPPPPPRSLAEWGGAGAAHAYSARDDDSGVSIIYHYVVFAAF